MPHPSCFRRSLRLCLACAVITAPGFAMAQNLSEVIQNGIANSITTIQDGRNFSFVVQNGTANAAEVTQEGRYNLSGLSQMGDGGHAIVEQIGDIGLQSTTQGSTRLSPISRSSTGNAGGLSTRFDTNID
jgi:hypothetical protein